MAEYASSLTGDEWEDLAHQLLLRRHPSYQQVPAEHKGDYGVDGFTSDGCVYQCYGPDPMIPIKKRYEDQRDKATSDLGKVVKNRTVIAGWLGTPITRWVLFVPRFDSAELVSHVASKAFAIRAGGYEEFGADFEGRVHDASQYGPEIDWALSTKTDFLLPLKDLGGDESPVELSSRWVETLRDKLAHVEELSEDRARQMMVELQRWYAKGVSLRTGLREFPTAQEGYIEVVKSTEAAVAIDLMLNHESPLATLRRLRSELAAAIKDQVPALGGRAGDELALALVAEWLMDCSLDWRDT